MRKVMDKRMVCHVWANQAQSEARTPTGNLYFQGPTLYSYGSHYVIGHFMPDGAVLWNASSSSNTTNAHKAKAWQALTGWQRGNMYYVPSLTSDDVLRLGKRKGAAMGLIDACVKHIGEIMQGALTHRKIELINAKLDAARTFERTAQYLCKLEKRKYPIDLLPDSLDNKEELETLVRKLRKAELLKQYESDLHNAGVMFENAERRHAHPAEWESQADTLRVLQDAYRYAVKANDAYRTANGKASSACGKLLKQIAAVMPPYRIAADVEARQAARGELVRAIADLYAVHRRMKDKGRTGGQRYTGRREPHALQAARRAVERIGDAGPWTHALARFERAHAWRAAVAALQSNRENYQELQTSGSAKDRRNAAKQILENTTDIPAVFVSLYGEEMRTMQKAVREFMAQSDALIAAENAQRIADWKAGVSNVKPDRDAGTFARISHGAVETTLGAVVPLSDAVALVRLARVAMRRGGQSWPRGEGPRVGHFRLDSIAADGAAVIGCHEFSAEEACRVMTLIEMMEGAIA